jgi:hypothetical protein
LGGGGVHFSLLQNTKAKPNSHVEMKTHMPHYIRPVGSNIQLVGDSKIVFQRKKKKSKLLDKKKKKKKKKNKRGDILSLLKTFFSNTNVNIPISGL